VLRVFHKMGLAAHTMGLVAHTIGLAALLGDGLVFEFLVMKSSYTKVVIPELWINGIMHGKSVCQNSFA
jgi:hypothetical protein